MNERLFPTACAVLLLGLPCQARSPQEAPVNGMRPAEVRLQAIVGATVVPAPGERLENATIVMRDGAIAAVGTDVEVPKGAEVREAKGLTVYAGFIDAAVLVPSAAATDAASLADGGHWNPQVHPQVWTGNMPPLGTDLAKQLRALGFTAAAVYPADGIFRGSGTVVALVEEPRHAATYLRRGPMALSLDRSRGRYPSALIGTMALVRQTLLDAAWYRDCRAVYAAHPEGNEPPVRAEALEALEDVLAGTQPVLFDVKDEHDALRAARLLEEFRLRGMLLGSGLEFRRLAEIAATGLPIIVPVQFPKTPEVADLRVAEQIPLADLLNWEQAPTNPRRLAEAGVAVALTTNGLKKRDDFHAAMEQAGREGLTPDMALAALTTAPARMLGLDRTLGTIEPGKIANLVVMEGELLSKKPKVREVWVNGRRIETNPSTPFAFEGRGTLLVSGREPLPVLMEPSDAKLTVTAPKTPGTDPDEATAPKLAPENEPAAGADAKADAKPSSDAVEADDDSAAQQPSKPRAVRATNTRFTRDRVVFTLPGNALGEDGVLRFSGVLVGGVVVGDVESGDGQRRPFTIERIADGTPAAMGDPALQADGQDGSGKDGSGKDGEGKEQGKEQGRDAAETPERAVELAMLPLGDFGIPTPPAPRTALIVNATLWTCGPTGLIQRGWMLVRDGRIVGIGDGAAPSDAASDGESLVIDAAGKHVTPGMIDCHSHTGIHGGVNEGTQANTAEVRIADAINPDDVNWYRQLAGGVTAVNQLHGSANPIGGQNSVVKLKWGSPAAAFPIASAVPGIKFALGENVVRSPDRYPNTRMGVEAYLVDAFDSARAYRKRHADYASLDHAQRSRTMPPRKDLELEALVEILEGERLVHCHSYRQDEILALIRVADRFGFRIGTLQHILEGYKVADAIAQHGAGASSFSDWWAYKVEVMDAIPYNGAILHDQGVLVSFNSDSNELARRLNTEAAKAVRYGGIAPEEALKFVTINPARQLRIDDRTGSLEVGKDADFVLWSGNPLSGYTRCEQTWVDGAPMFDLATDAQLRAGVVAEHARLVARAMRAGSRSGGSAGGEAGKGGAAEGAPGKPDEGRPGTLLARMREQAMDELVEMVQHGIDPLEVGAGECGCGVGDAALNRLQSGGVR